MKTPTQTITNPVVNQVQCTVGKLLRALVAPALLLIVSGPASAEQTAPLNIDPVIGQAVFASPEIAAQALTDAIDAGDREAAETIFGARFADLMPMDPIDREDVDTYLALYAQKHTLLPESDHQRVLAIGEEGWTFPVPIIKADRGWHFDTAAGIERVRIRQIGRNELGTIQAALAYYDAQKEYAEHDRNGDGILEYAQKFRSTLGQQDGLYWEVDPGEQPSPLGPLFDGKDLPDGAYHGYHYRILKSQGANAPGGAYDYVIGGRMIGGFALVAWPAEYGESGIMSFMVSHDGIVYENNLGPDGASAATAMQAFNPEAGWVPVQETHDAQLGVGSD